ncbi:tRNA pseudouridine(55) synthase TruB [Cytophagaceae bacterium ABcell3]|nr:tRNA pseudouridine(55) synthase TruB [Cytophagaceae bacterium ABcell3]
MNINTDFESGQVLLIDKPYKWTSFDVVKKLRNQLKVKKIGHAGTLDPLATGLLVLCTGKFTKRIESFQAQEKEYVCRMLLGKSTPSFDLETPFDCEYDISAITESMIKANLVNFLGTQWQIPPVFSAVKVNGVRSYEKARRGEDVAVRPRSIFIRELEITDISLPEITFRLVCSKGTYVRSLVRDFAKALGTGGCMLDLRRTRIGGFNVASAYKPEDFIKIVKNEII